MSNKISQLFDWFLGDIALCVMISGGKVESAFQLGKSGKSLGNYGGQTPAALPRPPPPPWNSRERSLTSRVTPIKRHLKPPPSLV